MSVQLNSMIDKVRHTMLPIGRSSELSPQRIALSGYNRFCIVTERTTLNSRRGDFKILQEHSFRVDLLSKLRGISLRCTLNSPSTSPHFLLFDTLSSRTKSCENLIIYAILSSGISVFITRSHSTSNVVKMEAKSLSLLMSKTTL